MSRTNTGVRLIAEPKAKKMKSKTNRSKTVKTLSKPIKTFRKQFLSLYVILNSKINRKDFQRLCCSKADSKGRFANPGFLENYKRNQVK